MSAKELQTVAVIGAGNMGSGIAQKYAAEGLTVRVLDLDAAALERGRERIAATLKEAVARKIYREPQAQAIEGRLHFTTDWKDLADVDLAVEAVFEDLEVKREVFRKLAAVMRPDALLATNTSSFRVAEVAEGIPHPERVIGLHYFYHPAKNRLVEVIPGPKTPAAVERTAWSSQERIGKTPIASADAAGFIVNRFFVPWINEAARLDAEGVANRATIEQAAIEAFRIGMGPFELMNVTGIPIGYHAAATLEKAFGAFYAPSDRIREMMEKRESFDYSGEVDRSKFELVRERLQGVTFHVASALVSEGVGAIEDVDIGARVGLRWAEGPFEMMNRIGIHEAFRITRLVEQRYGLPTPRLLSDQVREGVAFPIRLVKYEVRDGVARLTFNRPDAMNALNPEVARQLEARVADAQADPKVKGIVLAGAGKAFVAGADISFFVKNIERGHFDEIAQFASQGHGILDRLQNGAKPVVVELDGLALGGGLELALAADRIVASEKAAVGFPETGIGIYPGLGGTQRPSRRAGVALTRWLVLTGQIIDAKTAQAIGFIDEVVSRDDLDAAARRAIEKGKADRSGPALSAPPERALANPMLTGLARFFAEHDAERILTGEVETGGSPEMEKMVGRIRGKAPLALRLADRLIRDGSTQPLAQALRGELGAIEEIFRSADALEGLSALLARRAPKFVGR